jgi:exopolysaccharide biosynthesis polyprenyl glycosylphosphotransferase
VPTAHSAAARLLRLPIPARGGVRAAGAIPEGAPSTDVIRRDSMYRRSLAAADLAAATLAIFLAVVAIGHAQPTIGSLIVVPLLVLIGKLVGLYDRDEKLLRKSTLEEVPSLFSVVTLFAFSVWLLDGLAVQGTFGRVEVLSLWILSLAFMVVGRGAARSIVRRFAPEERCLVLGDEDSARAMRHKFEVSFSLSASVVGRVPLDPERRARRRTAGPHIVDGPPVLGTVETLGLALVEHDVHRVIVIPRSPEAEATLEAIRVVKSLGVRVSVCPRMFEVVGSSVDFDEVDGMTLLGLHGSRLSSSSLLLKRAMDVTAAAGGLVVLAPLFGAIALAIKLTSPGPVFFPQKRIGRGGAEFQMLKFRSMRDGADAEKDELRGQNETEGLFKIADDPRITSVGHVIRKSSLDELPQLWNVLRGEMSLVGPRPLVPEDDAQIQGWQRERLALVPGMTGHWQILGSTRVPLEEMVKIDYLYGASWSIWKDVKILLRTFSYVAGARSA